MARFKKLVEGKNGWSPWQFPVMTGYLMACCDCGLVHQMEFVAVEAGQERKGGRFTATSLPRGRYRVKMRAKRAPKHTAKLRKKEGITLEH